MFTILWQPTVGIEYEDRLEAPSTASTGGAVRAFAEVGLSISPLIDALEGRLEFLATLKHWQDGAESSGVDDGRDGHDLVETSLNYWASPERNFGFGIAYRNGEDPTKGIPDQEFFQISALVKF